MEEPDWYHQLFQEDDDLNDAWGTDHTPAFSGFNLTFPVQHHQTSDAPDESYGVGPGISPWRTGEETGASTVQRDLLSSQSSGDGATVQTSFQSSPRAPRKKGTRLPRIPGGYPCEHCRAQGETRKFDTDGALRKHSRQVHMPKVDRPLGCEVCEERFIDQKDMRRHLSRHPEHKIPANVLQHGDSDTLAQSMDGGMRPESPVINTNRDTEQQSPPSSSKRRRRSSSASNQAQHSPGVLDQQHTTAPRYETKPKRHQTTHACIIAACQDIRRFVGNNASQITITATMGSPADRAMIFVARHEIPMSCGTRERHSPAAAPKTDASTNE